MPAEQSATANYSKYMKSSSLYLKLMREICEERERERMVKRAWHKAEGNWDKIEIESSSTNGETCAPFFGCDPV